MLRALLCVVVLSWTVACSSTKRDFGRASGAGGTEPSTPSTGGGGGRAEAPSAGGNGSQVVGGSSSRGGSDGEAGAVGTACTAGDVRCGGAEVETTVEKCGSAQSGFTAVAYCSDTGAQCNPTTGTCMKLVIDATEVTRADYKAFIDAGGVKQVDACAAINPSLQPDATCMSDPSVCSGSNCGNHPQVCVDWCDAYSYCDAQGQRLCGRIGGGMNPFDRFADPGSSEWMNACSAGGQYKYGSGDRVDSGPQFCSYRGTQLGTTHPVGARKSCTSPSPTYESFFDLSGNVAEWEDSCEKAIDADGADGADACRTRGGSFNSALAALSCDTIPASALRRDAVSPEVGFRCCAK